MANEQSVNDFSGVGIGRTSDNGDVYSHSGVRIGALDADGYVVDDSHVRIGRARSVAGSGASE